MANRGHAKGQLLAGVLGLMSLFGSVVFAQSTGMQNKTPEFEVASIKPANPDPSGGGFGWVIDGLRGTLSVKILIAQAYSIPPQYIFGEPGWVDSSLYSVNAKIDDLSIESMKKMSIKEANRQRDLMLQSLLKERFKLQVRQETKELPVYSLVVAKGGPKLTPSQPAKPGPDGKMPPEGATMNMTVADSVWKLVFRQMSMEELPGYLIGIDRKVLNETGVQGKYDFELSFQPDLTSSDGPSIFTALQEQLGLKLEAKKGPVEMLLVEHVERPSEN
jgi:uncharacterized protein (TIGR03435 family)